MDTRDRWQPPVPYMARTRDWYLALGFDNPYEWAQFDAVPFAPLPGPLDRLSVALVTTAAPYQPDKGPQGPGAPYNAAAKFYQVYSGDVRRDHDLRISHVAIDRVHTTMEDPGCWFPLPALRAVEGRRIGRLAPRFHGLPTNRSQRHTQEIDAPELLRRCRADGADVALFVANCPVCHQSCALAARHLEAAGIPTVILGCARDVVEHCGVPRFLFSDFPLGNAAGRPFDPVSQAETLDLALSLLEEATGPRTTRVNPQRWAVDDQWKRDYSNVATTSPETLAAAREKAHADRDIARKTREGG
ncbi:glycine reductase [Pseudooceanicola aestuarii]|uniref:glycine reductase n=1 Tax=Pseudooceanicola aestuarii TaxID=2697319 RepID=UPI00195364AC|nr:glycine reductase [Pseudooceanicola aestuarii]